MALGELPLCYFDTIRHFLIKNKELAWSLTSKPNRLADHLAGQVPQENMLFLKIGNRKKLVKMKIGRMVLIINYPLVLACFLLLC